MKLSIVAFGSFLIVALVQCSLAQERPGFSDVYLLREPLAETPAGEAVVSPQITIPVAIPRGSSTPCYGTTRDTVAGNDGEKEMAASAKAKMSPDENEYENAAEKEETLAEENEQAAGYENANEKGMVEHEGAEKKPTDDSKVENEDQLREENQRLQDLETEDEKVEEAEENDQKEFAMVEDVMAEAEARPLSEVHEAEKENDHDPAVAKIDELGNKSEQAESGVEEYSYEWPDDADTPEGRSLGKRHRSRHSGFRHQKFPRVKGHHSAVARSSAHRPGKMFRSGGMYGWYRQ